MQFRRRGFYIMFPVVDSPRPRGLARTLRHRNLKNNNNNNYYYCTDVYYYYDFLNIPVPYHYDAFRRKPLVPGGRAWFFSRFFFFLFYLQAFIAIELDKNVKIIRQTDESGAVSPCTTRTKITLCPRRAS